MNLILSRVFLISNRWLVNVGDRGVSQLRGFDYEINWLVVTSKFNKTEACSSPESESAVATVKMDWCWIVESFMSHVAVKFRHNAGRSSAASLPSAQLKNPPVNARHLFTETSPAGKFNINYEGSSLKIQLAANFHKARRETDPISSDSVGESNPEFRSRISSGFLACPTTIEWIINAPRLNLKFPPPSNFTHEGRESHVTGPDSSILPGAAPWSSWEAEMKDTRPGKVMNYYVSLRFRSVRGIVFSSVNEAKRNVPIVVSYTVIGRGWRWMVSSR